MSLEERFGELRSFLEKRPSSQTFDLVIQALEAGAKTNEDRVRAEWLPYAEQRLASWPDHTRLCPKRRNDEFVAGESIWQSLIRALDYVGEKMGKNQMEDFLAAPGLENITCLDMRSTSMTWDKVAEFAERAPCRLKSFGFRRVSSLDDAALVTLFSSKMLAECEHLNFRGWDKGATQVFDVLMAHFPLSNLTRLDLAGGVISSRKLGELLATNQLDNLEVLDLGTWVSDKRRTGFISKLAKHGGLKNLRELHIEGHKPKEIEVLAKSDAFSELRELDLRGELSTKSLGHILESEHLQNLESLRIYVTGKDAADCIAMLAASERLAGIRSLHLSWYANDGNVPKQTYADLFESPHIVNLERFAITLDRADALPLLFHAEKLANLQELLLDEVDDSDDALKMAAREAFEATSLRKLRRFSSCLYKNGDLFVEELIMSALPEQLTSLRVQNVKAARLIDLFKSPRTRNIEHLDLSDMGYPESRDVIPSLSKATQLKSLRYLIMDSHYRVDDLREHVGEHGYNLPELLHVGCPEYAFLQSRDWLG